MSDTPELQVANDPEGDLFAPMPTPAWAHLIETRLQELEQAHADGTTGLPADVPPAGLTPEQEEQILTALRGIDESLSSLRTDVDILKTRATTQRSDIDAVKVHQNALLDVLKKAGLVSGGSPL